MIAHFLGLENSLTEVPIVLLSSSVTVTMMEEVALAFLTSGSFFMKRVREGRMPVASWNAEGKVSCRSLSV